MKALAFLLRFVAFVPVCLVGWWLVMPYYGWIIAQIAAQIMGLFGKRITAVQIEAAGILNTETLLTLESASGTQSDMIGSVVTNTAPFIALVLATSGLGIKRRFQVMGTGAAILMASHIIYLVWAVALAPNVGESPELPIVVAQVFITMPFLLWIVLAYWRTLLELMTPESPQS